MSNTVAVAVTGATGYVAGAVIAKLFELNKESKDVQYEVRGTVRELPSSGHHVLHDAFPDLKLFEANLLEPGSYDEAFAGCKYVLHLSSPFQLEVKDAQKELVDPALKGTENVIRAAFNSATVERIVLTSSVAAIFTEDPVPLGKVFTEDDWNHESTLERGSYSYSKRVAEERAWELVRELGGRVELAVICPSFVMGRPSAFSPSLKTSTSVQFAKGLIEGKFIKDGAPINNMSFVDVHDVAQAHVTAMLKPEAAGNRYICASENTYTYVEVAGDLRARGYDHLPLPVKLEAPAAFRMQFCHDKAANELGLKFKPHIDSICEMIDWLIENKLATPNAIAEK